MDGYIPKPTGQVFTLKADTPEVALFFGECADEVNQLLKRAETRPVRRYVQIVKQPENKDAASRGQEEHRS